MQFKNILITLIIFGSIFPSFSFAQNSTTMPDPTPFLDQTKIVVQKIINAIMQTFPNAIKGVWQDVWGFWGKIGDWFKKNLWDSFLFPKLENIWQKVLSFFGKKIEEKKPTIEQGIEEERQELKEGVKEGISAGISETKKSLWQKFIDTIK